MEPNKSNSRTVSTIIVIIAVIFIAGLGVYFYSLKQATTQPETNTNQNATSTLPATTTNESATSSTGTVSQVNLYFIALEDQGKSGKAIGCGDSVVAVQVPITPTQAPLKAVLEKLFAVKSRDYGESGLMNALSQSNLKVDSATISQGVATVKLSGSVSLGGVCDDPRFIAQIKETVLQFPTVTSAVITINGKSLESYGSEK